MYRIANRIVDWFIPAKMAENDSDRLMARTFVALHLVGPLMGHSVTVFLWQALKISAWQYWVTEAMVVSFFAVPFMVRSTGSIRLPAFYSVQMLVALSLFGSFFFGGISSPFLPWFLIAMVLGFFYLSNFMRPVLVGLAIQLMVFFSVRIYAGTFPMLLPIEELKLANLLSILAALTYMTLLSLYYEQVMRISVQVEKETVDQRQKLDELRNVMEVAEQASIRKSIFLAKMSHELRTPLNAVIGYTEMLRETFEEKAGANRKIDDLDRIHKAGQHLLSLVDDVIDLSSIESNRMELVQQPIEVASLVDEVVATASALVRKRDNRLVVNMPKGLGVVMLDALKLRQSILNLLSNAAKFTTKGTIMLTVLHKQANSSDWLVIEVSDNGIGMTPDGVKRLFSDFSQAEKDTSAKFGGTGLGLALTRRFTEMMGGTINVRSERGVGTSFTIEIPIQFAVGDSHHAAAAA